MGVSTPHDDYNEHQDQWRRCRDVLSGQDKVHAAGERYLPRLRDQTDDDYRAYVKRAGFFNASWRTVDGLRGMMFRKPPVQDVPAGIVPYLADVTMTGQDFSTFVKTVALEVLSVGWVGVMVDHPAVGNVQGITIDQAARLGLRPTMKIYPAESIINWQFRTIGNAWTLSQVRLKECHQVPDGEFDMEEVERFRVLDLDPAGFYRVRLFEVKDNKDIQIGDDVYPLMGGKKMTRLPFRFVTTDGMETEPSEPPLIDLIDLNLSHYRTNADYEHGCHFTGLPTPVVSGYQPDEKSPTLYIGSQAAWVFPDPSAKATFLEFSGQGLGALKEMLDRKEGQMAILGARMIAAEKKTAETATTAAIHRTGENSILSSIAIAVSQAMEWALNVFSAWAGQSGACKFDINREFLPATLDAQQINALLAAVQSGAMSNAELFDLFQRGDLIDGEKTFEEHQTEVEIQGGGFPVVQVA